MAAEANNIRRNCFMSVTGLFVHNIQKRPAGAEALEILDENLRGQAGPADCMIGRVRRQQHILETVKWVPLRERLLVENIQRSASNALRGKGTDESRFHN